MKAITLWMMVVAAGLLAACGNPKTTADAGLSTPLNADEIAGLKYMREEEELARDLYMTIFNNKGLTVFQNISLNSETVHAQKMLDLLNTYGETDPSTGIANAYTDPALQTLSDQLINTAAGATSTDLDALMVGALVEEVDIADINHEKSLVQPVHALIIQTYENLLCGSRNHLRAFVTQIEPITGVTYTPQVPALATEVAAILASPSEQCGR
ncbi:MAG TPA: DUF2202 domain-containing protein [Ghiorsea sp.]|nr:DUF2202 domain-containing protein [Ghiorsea sp.]HIP06453.1 DUF2202 domain-containing protein [Mariprofundaceae bacterium]